METPVESHEHVGLDMNYFFDEILIEVFGNLGLRMLKNCRLVCKRWDELISKHQNFFENYQTVLRTYEGCKNIAELRKKPKYVVVLDDCQLSPDVFNHLPNLYSLKIDLSQCEYELELSHLAQVLRLVPNLKILHVCDMNFIEDIKNMADFEKIKFNLIELNCNSELLHLLECLTLKNLNLRWHCNLPIERKLKVCEFVNQQKELENLSLNYPNDFFVHFISLNYEFKLKSFTFYSNVNFMNYESFILFLEPHKHSLNSLKIQMYSFEQSKDAIRAILKYVKKNVLNLNELELDTVYNGNTERVQILPKKLDSFDKLERFGYADIFYSLEDNKQLVDMLPKMKHLSIKSCFCKAIGLLEYEATKQKLESLAIFNFDKVTTSITFSNLKELSVHTFSLNRDGFKMFIDRHSKSLEKLTIGNDDGISPPIVNAISSIENLKHLTIDVSKKDFERIMTTFQDISLRSQPLTVIFKDYPTIVRFELPEDKIFWGDQITLS
ncbi:hypothetical protein ACKWTF_004339 [Chironomus riparius]